MERCYYSCNCRRCRHAPSNVKGWHKSLAHRKFRRLSKALIRRGDSTHPKVHTGYKD
jgi:hypothetical protein